MDQKAWVVVKGRHDITGICLEDVKTKHAVTCGGDEKHFESISVLVDDESSAEKLHQQFVTEKYEQIQKRKVVSIFAPH